MSNQKKNQFTKEQQEYQKFAKDREPKGKF